jgi:uncharacterized protein (TIGR03437 family)
MRKTLMLAACALAAAAEVTYTITTVAGGTFCGDGRPAAAAWLGAPEGLAVDRAGNIYVSDSQDHRIRKIDSSGVITTVAGDGHPGSRGDGGPATAAQLDAPYGLVLDGAGNLYVADLGNARVRVIAADGVIRAVAAGARFNQPRNVAVDRFGNLYISDFGDHRVYRVTRAGAVERVAGLGWPGSIGDGEVVVAEYAPLRAPADLAVDRNGTLYIADSGNGRVRKIERGLMSTVTVADIELALPTGLALDSNDNLYVADKAIASVVRLTPSADRVATAEQLQEPRAIAFDRAGNLLIADLGRVWELSKGGVLSTLAGGAGFRPLGDLGPPAAAHLEAPSGVAVGPDGALYIADRFHHRVRKVAGELIRTVAGAGTGGFSGDGGPAVEAELDQPAGLTLDSAGNLFVAEAGGSRIRRIDGSGLVTRVAGLAGAGASGYSGDGTPAVAARLNYPEGVAVDGAGNLYIGDTFNDVIRGVLPDGRIATLAGRGVPGYAGDGGLAAWALFHRPAGVSVDGAGNLYVADSRNNAIRRIGADGRVSTLLGQLNGPSKAVADAAGNLYVADTGNHRVLKISKDGGAATIAGAGAPGYGGDGGPALEAQLNEPADVAVDASGNVYIADRANNLIRRLTPGSVEPPPVELANLVNGASMLGGPLAPGEIVTIFGTGLGPESAAGARLDEAGLIETALGGGQVLFDGVPAPLLYVQAMQINLQVPYEAAGRGTTEIEVRFGGQLSARLLAAVTEAAPAIFTLAGGRGQAAALNESGALNSAAAPARRGSIVVLYATGEGQTNPGGVTGKPASAPYPAPVLAVSLAIGGQPAEILYAGSAPGYAGLMQVNARVPERVEAGPQPVELTVGEAKSQPGVTVAVE